LDELPSSNEAQSASLSDIMVSIGLSVMQVAI